MAFTSLAQRSNLAQSCFQFWLGLLHFELGLQTDKNRGSTLSWYPMNIEIKLGIIIKKLLAVFFSFNDLATSWI